MRTHVMLAALVLVGLEGPVYGGVSDSARIELRPPVADVERLDPAEFCEPTRLRLPTFHLRESLFHSPEGRSNSSIEFALPEVGPEELDLEVQYGRLLFKVGASMQDTRAVVVSPRLECDTRETYFWVRLSYDVDSSLSVFCESFQSAGIVLGVDTVHGTQPYVWDGLQVQAGLRWVPRASWTVEGGPVFYVLSATQLPTQVGVRIGLRWEF